MSGNSQSRKSSKNHLKIVNFGSNGMQCFKSLTMDYRTPSMLLQASSQSFVFLLAHTFQNKTGIFNRKTFLSLEKFSLQFQRSNFLPNSFAIFSKTVTNLVSFLYKSQSMLLTMIKLPRRNSQSASRLSRSILQH